ncbi:MAG TPA: hypothetical protein VF461_12740 [Gemmatimonadaceae bacterium]
MNRKLFRTAGTLAGVIGLLMSCTDTPTGTHTTALTPAAPSFTRDSAFNNSGQCMANDAVRAPSGTISGVKFGDDPATVLNCTSQDVKIATALVNSYRIADSAGNFSGAPIQYNPGDNVSCIKDRKIELTMSAKLNETASSTRSDIGIWLATDGGNAQTGLCNHYNLPVNPLEPGTGVSNGDNDSCGDLNAGAFVPNFPLGTFVAVCETSAGSNNQLHLGSCLGWTEPGADKVCPLPDAKPNSPPNWVTNSSDGFRFGTLYANKSKCNCEGFDVPITVINPPKLNLTKTADSATVSAGSQIGFVVTLSNTGAGPATTVALNDSLPAGTGISWSLAAPVTGWSITGSAPNQKLVFTSASFAAGANTSAHVISSTTGASCATYKNVAKVTLGNGPAPDSVTATTIVNCSSLGITKTPATQTVSAGTSFSWTVTLTNSGDGVAAGATILDSLPQLTGVAYTLGAGSDATCAINAANTVLTCGPKGLAKNATLVAVINATTTAGTSCSANGITNTATGKATGVSAIQATATTTINCPKLDITKKPASQTVDNGSPFSWRVSLINSGAGTAVGSTILDSLPQHTGVAYTLGAGSDATCSINAAGTVLTCTSKDLAPGDSTVAIISATTAGGTSCSASGISNTATGKASGLSSVQATAKTIINCPSLGITKTPTTQTVGAGSPFSWVVTLTNSGAGTALAAKINDSLPVVTGVSYTLGSSSPSGANCAITSGKLVCGPIDLAPNASITATINATTQGRSCSTSGFTNTATGSATGVSNVQASATTTLNCPNLSIIKTPDDSGDTGYLVKVPGTATFTILVKNSSAANTGVADSVVLTDTLPGDATKITWTADNTTTCVSPIGTVVVSGVTRSRLVCNIGTMAAGDSFKVHVSAPVTASNLQQPPVLGVSPIDIDGDLVAGGGRDWASLATSGLISCLANPKVGCDLDKTTGSTDDALGQGTKEDDASPSVVTGSIPNNKSDLQRFYVVTERIGSNNFLYLAWERVQAPSGTTNMDFELNQSSLKNAANGTTPVRTAGDILIQYDLAKGGTTPVLGFQTWLTSGSSTLCEAASSLPCWSKVDTLLAGAKSAVNTANGTSDPILAPQQVGARSLDKLTFGEASIDLQTAGIFPANACVNFGQAYLKSRSSDAFTSEVKDFIAPIPVSVTNCAPLLLPNTAWVKATNVSAAKSDTGEIKVTLQ